MRPRPGCGYCPDEASYSDAFLSCGRFGKGDRAFNVAGLHSPCSRPAREDGHEDIPRRFAVGIAYGTRPHAGHKVLPVLDGVASLLVGFILVIVALFLVYESKGLIVGESADADVVSRIRRISQADPAVDKVKSVLTMYFGPENVLLNMNVSFRPELSNAKLADVVNRLEGAIRREAPDIKRIFIETKSLTN